MEAAAKKANMMPRRLIFARAADDIGRAVSQ